MYGQTELMKNTQNLERFSLHQSTNPSIHQSINRAQSSLVKPDKAKKLFSSEAPTQSPEFRQDRAAENELFDVNSCDTILAVMAFKDFPRHTQGVQLLQRSLGRRLLAHG